MKVTRVGDFSAHYVANVNAIFITALSCIVLYPEELCSNPCLAHHRDAVMGKSVPADVPVYHSVVNLTASVLQ